MVAAIRTLGTEKEDECHAPCTIVTKLLSGVSASVSLSLNRLAVRVCIFNGRSCSACQCSQTVFPFLTSFVSKGWLPQDAFDGACVAP